MAYVSEQGTLDQDRFAQRNFGVPPVFIERISLFFSRALGARVFVDIICGSRIGGKIRIICQHQSEVMSTDTVAPESLRPLCAMRVCTVLSVNTEIYRENVRISAVGIVRRLLLPFARYRFIVHTSQVGCE